MTVRTLFLGALAGLAAAAAEAADKPLVVELFTSQGCNSCPPADRHLTTLAARPDLIALSLHVDYWDYLGWRDSFGSPAHGRRQRAYQAGLGGRSIYTPQLVIGGAAQAVGSDQGAVAKAIAAAPRPVLDLAVEGERLKIGPGGGGPAEVWLVRFDPRHEVAIARGENAGRTLIYANVVRGWEKLGLWEGRAQDLPLPRFDQAAIIIQREGGPILGALRLGGG